MPPPFFGMEPVGKGLGLALQLCVLVFQGFQPFGIGDVHPVILRLPVIQRLGDPMLARQVARLCSRLMLTQNRDDLLSSVNRFLFISPSFNRGRTPQVGEITRGRPVVRALPTCGSSRSYVSEGQRQGSVPF